MGRVNKRKGGDVDVHTKAAKTERETEAVSE